jgi:hypothetical protein
MKLHYYKAGLSWVFGKPKEQMDMKTDSTIEVIFVDGKTIL